MENVLATCSDVMFEKGVVIDALRSLPDLPIRMSNQAAHA